MTGLVQEMNRIILHGKIETDIISFLINQHDFPRAFNGGREF
jgi:hypothetical protein